MLFSLFTTYKFTCSLFNVIIFFQNNYYLGIGLHNGHLKLAWPSNENKHTLVKNGKYNDSTSEILPNLGILADAEWHVIALNITNLNTSLKIDDELVYTMQNIRNHQLNNFVEIYLGKSLYPSIW